MYKKVSIWLFPLLALLGVNACEFEKNNTISPVDPIDSLMQTMTLAEKVGQMTQINLPVLLKREHGEIVRPIELDPQQMSLALDTYCIGSLINTVDHALDRVTWLRVMQGIHSATENRGRLPIIYGIDAIHGANYTMGSTLFPHQLMQAASFNDSLVLRAAAITAYECRSTAIPWVFSPILDLGRQPLWTQFFETFGEDPYLAGRMGRAMVKGYQNQGAEGSVAACAKHFVGAGMPFTGKDRTPVHIGPRTLREVYMAPFCEAIEAGVKSIMVGTHEVDGIPMHANGYLLRQVLRNELGFQGVVLSDWGDIQNLHQLHRVSPNKRTSVKMAIEAGIDMVMVPNDFTFCRDLLDLVATGEIEESRIDSSVRRILKLKEDMGLLSGWTVPSIAEYGDFGSRAHQAAAYELAVEGITLLKNNEEVLPLNREQKVMVFGPSSNDLVLQHGSWTRTWQGRDTLITNEGHLTFWQAAKSISHRVTYVDVGEVDRVKNLDSLQDVSKSMDVIVVCLGEEPATEKPGDISDLSISKAQQELVTTALGTKKPVVLVLMQNRPQIIADFVDDCAAVVMAYQPGSQGGKALADILYGLRNPSGKLPFSYPRFVNEFMTYDHKAIEEVDPEYGNTAYRPLWTFGHGLSYTTFSYTDFELSADSMGSDDTLVATITVANTGMRKGKEVVMAFVSDEVASVVPPVERLRGYEKIEIGPGQRQRIEIRLPIVVLAFAGKDHTKTVLESGSYTIRIADQNRRFYIYK